MANGKHLWDANIYSQFLAARTRPAKDLLSAIPKDIQPKRIYDLGCGPGNSTILLKENWPKAKVVGIDTSDEMLNMARNQYANIEFISGDISKFLPSDGIDIIFSNASLQWVDNHKIIIPKLISYLNVRGVLAIQMPNNFHSPSHQLTIEILKGNLRWRPLIKCLPYSELQSPMYQVDYYYNLLAKSELSQLNLWETMYYQEMSNHNAIYDWACGTNLRSILSNMNDDDKDRFTKQYIDQLIQAFPLKSNGKILFPFRRIFMIGLRVKK